MIDNTPSLGTWASWHEPGAPIRLGVSACLLGQEVRFDGGHTRDPFVTETLGRWVEWVSVCPEVEMGMSTPRAAIRLVDTDEGQRLIAPSTGEDFTQRMQAFAKKRSKQLAELELDGYVLQKNSPSCGLERISVYRGSQRAHRKGVGMFVQALQAQMPQLPMEEDGRLNDHALRDNFIERIFCRHRWRTLARRDASRGRLVEFHTAHKMLLRTHGEAGYARLGNIVANAPKLGVAALFKEYETQFHACLQTLATNKRHANVLQHALGYFKLQLDPVEKREILSAIADYRTGLLPLVVPLTLIRFQIRKHENAYLTGQLYFDPHPKELMLRNHS